MLAYPYNREEDMTIIITESMPVLWKVSLFDIATFNMKGKESMVTETCF